MKLYKWSNFLCIQFLPNVFDTWMFDFFELDDANGKDDNAGHDDDGGRDEEGVGMILEAAE